MNQEGLVALVFGPTGAIGMELIASLLRSPHWTKVHCVVRNEPEEWKTLAGKEKLIVQKFANLDEYFSQANLNYKHVNAVFSCLGTQTKHGEETFIKIDKTYPLLAADIAVKNNIRHYSLCSSTGGDENSSFLYMRVKGEVERDLKTKEIRNIAIHKPGLLKNRRNARCGQKFFGCFCCCFPSIEAEDCAATMRIVAENCCMQPSEDKKVEVFENSDMRQIVERKKN